MSKSRSGAREPAARTLPSEGLIDARPAVTLAPAFLLDAASHALGHSDLPTTLGIYGHFDETDLETAMNRYAAWLEKEQIVLPEEST